MTLGILPVVLIAVATLVLGIGGTLIISRMISKARANSIIEEAKLEAEVIMKNKIIEAKEAEMAIKSEAEKQANLSLSIVQSAEA